MQRVSDAPQSFGDGGIGAAIERVLEALRDGRCEISQLKKVFNHSDVRILRGESVGVRSYGTYRK